jgi:ribonuclease R
VSNEASAPPGGRGRAARSGVPAAGPPADVLPPEAIVGAVVAGDDGRLLAPFDPRAPELPLDGAGGVPAGRFVVAAPAARRGRGRPARPSAETARRPPGPEEPPARVRVTELLGDPEAPGVDAEVVLRHHRIPRLFPPAALAEAAALPEEPRPEDLRGRVDLRSTTVVTIDGADARDFDDALSVEPLDDARGGPAGGAGAGGWRLGVHIADVAHYVAAGASLDREAERRGTSVYFPGRVVPMLPEALSAGLCSLRPGVPRLTVSAWLEIDRGGRIRRRRFAESVIASARRLTYGEVTRLLEAGRPADARDYGPVLPLLRHLRDLMAALHRRRRERGSLDFDLPEGDVELDTDGTTVGVQPGERTVAHRIVEEAMIAANEAVAEALERAGGPALYRVHDPPAAADVETLAAALAGLGLELPAGGAAVAPADLARVQRRAAGKPWEGFVNSLLMRTLRAASYSPDNRGHFALASRHYTHFTSPIRRYPDLVVHRRVKALARRGGGAAKGERAGGGAALAAVAAAASEAERRATRAERDLLQWKKVRFLADRVGEIFPGRITGVQPYGLFVQLDRYLVDGLVPVRTLGRDYFRFDADGHRLVGDHTGRAFRLGDPVTVTLTGVSEQHRGLDLALATSD